MAKMMRYNEIKQKWLTIQTGRQDRLPRRQPPEEGAFPDAGDRSGSLVPFLFFMRAVRSPIHPLGSPARKREDNVAFCSWN